MACRCHKDNVTIFTPNTKKEHALLLRERIEKRLAQEAVLLDANMQFHFVTVEYNCKESIEELLARINKELDNL